MKLDLSSHYQAAFESLMNGDSAGCLKFVDRLRRAERRDPLEEMALKLLSVRMALKSGNVDVDSIPVSAPANGAEERFFSGEAHVVNALIDLNRERPQKAHESFLASAEIFSELGLAQKALMGRFNALVARCEYDESFVESNVRFELTRLMAEADRAGERKIRALCARHLSYLLLDEGKYQASLETARIAEEIFLDLGPISDHSLVLAHMSLCHHLLADQESARAKLELIPRSGDHRLLFPIAVLRFLLFGEAPREEDFAYQSGRWQENFERYALAARASRKLAWDQKSTVIFDGGSIVGRVRPASREGFLLRLLSDAPRSRVWLLSALWPGITDQELLEDRLVKLMKRIDGKLGGDGAIVLEAGVYRLGVELCRK